MKKVNSFSRFILFLPNDKNVNSGQTPVNNNSNPLNAFSHFIITMNFDEILFIAKQTNTSITRFREFKLD